MTTTKTTDVCTTAQMSEQGVYPSDEQRHSFAKRLLAWFELHGRHGLPWQYHHQPSADIYAVWVSEIMLQQTQVVTVLKFFEPFLARFTTVQELAVADWQEVASFWAGLGYYARARNLHTGAQQVADFIDTHGRFPETVNEWQAVKGVGRSTAGAIVAMGVKKFGVICDGNVKRVLARHRAVCGDVTKSATDKRLWEIATTLTPKEHSGHYAQAMMDLGATICTRTQPKCHLCPVSDDCIASALGVQSRLPVKKKAPPKPHWHSIALSLTHRGLTLWLHRQNGGGIWDGLWSLPIFMLPLDDNQKLDNKTLSHAIFKAWQSDDKVHDLVHSQLIEILPTPTQTSTVYLRHTLTHVHWHLYEMSLCLNHSQFNQINQTLTALGIDYLWTDAPHDLPLPAAMHKLLTLSNSSA